MQWLILIYWTLNMCMSCMVGYIDAWLSDT